MDATTSPSSRWTRLWYLGAALALIGGILVVVGALQTTDAGGGNAPCPGGSSLVLKFEYEGGYSGGDGTVTITGDATGGSWTSTVPISSVIVKGGPDSIVVTYDPPATSGDFSNAGLPPVGSGNIPDISNIQFCAPTAVPPTTTTAAATTTTEAATTTSEAATTTTEAGTTTTDAGTTTTEAGTTTTEAGTTTTDAATTTTGAATTTTVAGTTTTQVATTTTEAGVAPATGVVSTTSAPAAPTTTTTEVTAVAPSTSIVTATGSELGRTGAPSALLITIGAVLLLGGITLVVAGRRGGRTGSST